MPHPPELLLSVEDLSAVGALLLHQLHGQVLTLSEALRPRLYRHLQLVKLLLYELWGR